MTDMRQPGGERKTRVERESVLVRQTKTDEEEGQERGRRLACSG